MEAGVQFGRHLRDEAWVKQLWAESRWPGAGQPGFVAKAVWQVFRRFDVECQLCRIPPLVLTPRPLATALLPAVRAGLAVTWPPPLPSNLLETELRGGECVPLDLEPKEEHAGSDQSATWPRAETPGKRPSAFKRSFTAHFKAKVANAYEEWKSKLEGDELTVHEAFMNPELASKTMSDADGVGS